MSEVQTWNQKVDHPIQSWQWGEFRRANGNKVSRVGNFQVIWSQIPKTNFYFGYCGKCPVPSESDIESLTAEAHKIGGLGIRFEPNILKNSQLEIRNLISGRRFFTPKTYYLDLTKTEDELLRRMHPKARYNIKLAQKHGVTIEQSDDIGDFLRLTNETKNRQGFYAHNDEYFKNMWKHLKDSIAHLFIARYQGEVLATWIIFKFGNFIYYPYGASSDKHREVMATSLLLWEVAKWGKSQGCTTFDLWGLEEGKGFTDFKRRFGPSEIEFVGTYDLPTSPLYWLFRWLENIRWWILGSLRHTRNIFKV